MKRAVNAGCTQPLLYLTASLVSGKGYHYEKAYLVALTAALGSVYASPQLRSFKGEETVESVKNIGFTLNTNESSKEINALIKNAKAVEIGKRLARDIGSADPEFGTPIKCTNMVLESFKDIKNVKIQIISDENIIKNEYPLFAAVARTSFRVPRHHPRIVKIVYEPENFTKQVYITGKGVTYDTGGVDVKINGNMSGMSRDKCGAAVAAGFVRTAAELQSCTKIVCNLAFVRNSVGSDSYVSDEIITAKSGKRVLIVNTDAEGRLALSDLLYDCVKDIESQDKNSKCDTYVHTIATLTGHAVLTVGLGYTISVENGPAKKNKISERLKAEAEKVADGMEFCSVRREDVAYVSPKTPEYDIYQCGTAPSSQTPRGHQFPAAFLINVSNLDKHGLDSEDPINYTHLDVAASTVNAPFSTGVVNGNPVPALCSFYLGI